MATARERGARIETVIGDARLTLAQQEPASFDMLIADAFSSDAIPVHLLTREAVDLYISRVRTGGAVMLHISNRYLDLEPVLANIAAELGLACYVQHDVFLDQDAVQRTGQQNSSWIVMARHVEDLRPLLHSPIGARWSEAQRDPSLRTWTDRYTNIVGVMEW